MTSLQGHSSNGWTAASLFAGDGDTARAHREADWARTALGPVESWPIEVASAVSTVFASDVAMLLWLGPDLVQVFNDAYRPVLGVKYPDAIGQPAAVCWPDVWADMGPLAVQALGGQTAKGTEVRLLMDRRGGLLEETYWTFSYSPIRAADSSVLGVFVATSEVTGSVLTRRRMNALQQLGGISATRDAHPVDTCRTAVSLLATYESDFPLVMAYVDPESMFDSAGRHRLGSVENEVTSEIGRSVELVAVGGSISPDDAHRWIADGPGVKAVAAVTEFGVAQHLHGLSGDGNGRGPLVSGVPLDDVMVLPLRVSGREDPVGALVVGTSPFQIVDDMHASFLDVVASRISTTLTDVLAYEFQRQRTSALSELDVAKTRFLENVSHEFRTPLTMLVAPLRGLQDTTTGADREYVDVAYRNAVRLRELVDSLLDVAAASAGSISVDREPTDVAELTQRCIAQFAGAVEAAGLRLDVTLDVPESVYVSIDPEKWTRIVSNLLANAINYTHEGAIGVSLARRGPDLLLEVSDTGIGISESDAGSVFDRFFRATNAHGRSAEGSGIGLALVAELAAALGGAASVQSTPGEGSTFTVVVAAPDAAGDFLDASSSAGVYEPHVLRASEDEPAVHRGVRGGATRTVLVVEDNADMVHFLVRSLTAQNWDVVVARTVESALAHARSTRPGLVLTDIMLPGRSGLDLVRELRSDPSLVRVPVVVLTARAAPGSAVEGLEAGADDYITKPFDPRELIARIRVHLELSAIREEILAASNNEAATLQEALRTRSTIGTAIGLIMAAESCDADTAFGRLTTLSQNSNRKARDVAADLVRGFTQ